jgi:hypothetical protein
MKIPVLLLAAASVCAAADSKTLVGAIGDNMCKGDHSAMHGADAAKCTKDCVKGMGAKYALWVDKDGSGKDVYSLSDQVAAAKFAGKKVSVTGDVNGADIRVTSIKAAK